MAFIYNVRLVKYLCSCSTWQPLCQLHFCRKCNQLRCALCLTDEIDNVYCPNCMDDIQLVDNAQKKSRCAACNECPYCDSLLLLRSAEGSWYLRCNTCRWTSRDSLVPDKLSDKESWHDDAASNPLESKLERILAYLKELNNQEKLDQERSSQAKKRQRLSTLGVLRNDRYGLQSAYMARRKALRAAQQPEKTHDLDDIIASKEVPELDPSLLPQSFQLMPRTPMLQQILAQPVVPFTGLLLQNPTKFVSRRALHCAFCDTILYKGEFSVSVVKPRFQAFARDIYPEVRISRNVVVSPGQTASFFLTVTNNSVFDIDLDIKGETVEDDSNCVDASQFSLSMKLAPKESEIEPKDRKNIAWNIDLNEKEVIQMRRNKVGFCLECPISPLISRTDGYAILNLDFLGPQDLRYFCLVRVNLQYSFADSPD